MENIIILMMTLLLTVNIVCTGILILVLYYVEGIVHKVYIEMVKKRKKGDE